MKKKTWIWIGASAAAVVLGLWGIGSAVSARLQSASGGCETATVSADVIETTVVGTGSLAYGDSVDVSLPYGVDVTTVFYENGQRVDAGDLLAAVDTGGLELLMSETYTQIAEVDAKLRETPAEPEKVVVSAPVAGRVQAVYGSNGASVLETIAAHGSVLLISPDNRMQVNADAAGALPAVGSTVQLELPDGSRRSATVDSVREGSFTASFTATDADVGTAVHVLAEDGSTLGSGLLEAVDAVPVIGPAGTVEGMTVNPGAEVAAGADLFSVRSSAPPAAFQELDRKRQALTERYDLLANLRQNGGLTSPVTGVVTSCSVQEGTAAAGGEGSLSGSLGSLPAGLLDALGMDRATGRGVVTEHLGLQQGGRNIMLSAGTEPDEPDPDVTAEPTETPSDPPGASAPAPTAAAPRVIPRLSLPLLPPVPGLPLQHNVDLLPLCIGEVEWSPADEQAQFSTEYTASGQVEALEGFCFASDCTLNVPAGTVTALTVSEDGSRLSFSAAYEKTTDSYAPAEIDWDSIRDLLGLDAIDLGSLRDLLASGILSSDSLGFDLSQLTSGLGSLGSLAGLDASALSGLAGLDASALAGLNGSALAGLDAGALSGLSPDAIAALEESGAAAGEIPAYTIARDDSMQLLIQINQMDVLSVAPGMACTVTVDALEGQEFPGSVTDIAYADNGGSSTYTAKITMEKAPDMRSGMSASAIIVTSEVSSGMTIPAAAVQEDGSRVFVYTSYKDGEFGGEREITTGVSDGASVEVLSGLEDGDTVYYARTNPLERIMQGMTGPPGMTRSADDGETVQVSAESRAPS